MMKAKFVKYWGNDVHLSAWLLGLYIFWAPLDLILNFFGIGGILKFLGLTIICISAMELLFKERSTVPIKREYLAALLYSLYYLASLTWSYYESNPALVFTIFNMVLFYIMTTIRPLNKKEYAIIRFSSIFGAVIFSMIMIVNSNVMLYLERVTIILGEKIIDPNDMGANFILPFFLCVSIFGKKRKHMAIHVLLFISMFLISFAVLLTGSRGALLAVIISFAFYLIFNNHVPVKKKILQMILAIAICVFLYSLVSQYLPAVVRDRLTIESIAADKGSERLILWNDALNLFKNSDLFRIILGYGLANFPYLHENNYALLIGTHNLFIQNLIEGGLAGLFLLLLLFFQIFKRAIHKKDWVTIGFLIATIVVSCFLDTIYKKFFWNALIFASIQVISDNPDHSETPGCSESKLG